MRISELSRRSGVSAASIKYYGREGLLPAGERKGYNQTDYGDEHVVRLRLIRALIEAGRLSIAATQRVLAAIDDASVPLGIVFSIAQRAGSHPIERSPSAESIARIRELIRARGWEVSDDNPGIALAAGVLDGYAAIGRPELAASLDGYAEATDLIAETDLGLVERSGSRDRMAETVVVGTVLGDKLIAGLRRIAQEDQSHRRFRVDPAASAGVTRPATLLQTPPS